MKSAAAAYRPMPQDSLENLALLQSEGEDKENTRTPAEYRRTIRRLILILVLQTGITLAIVIMGSVLVLKERKNFHDPFPQTLYSPVQHAIEYQTKIFHEGFGADQSIYQQKPSPEVDAAWDDLYSFGVSRITKEEASQLVNQTYRIPGDEDHYVIQLDVFHQLHCLNMLRKGFHPEYYNQTEHDRQHWGHCIEAIRQSLVCSADVSPLVWQWVDRVQEVRIVGNIIHTCRNYDKIKEWGLERRMDHDVNFTGFK